MSEENELRVKFVIDDTDFRNQLDQLRGDLERKRRLEPGETRRPSQQPDVRISIGRGGDGDGMDDDLREELKQIREDIDDLERRSGLPGQFKELTLSNLNNMVKEAVQSPAWISTVSSDISKRILDEAGGLATRSYADVPMKELTKDLGRVSSVAAGLRLWRISGMSGREELIGAGRGAGMGLATEVGELESLTAKGQRYASGEAYETVAHQVLKGVGQHYLTATGKIVRKEVSMGVPGQKARFDLFSRFLGGKVRGDEDLPAIHAPEVKTGRVMGKNVIDQVANQIFVGLRLLVEDYGVTMIDIARDPVVLGIVSGEAARLTSTVFALEKHTPSEVKDFEQKVITTVLAQYETFMKTIGEDPDKIDKTLNTLNRVFMVGGIRIPLVALSPKMRRVMREAVDKSSHMNGEDQAEYVRDMLLTWLSTEEGKEDHDRMSKIFNPTFREGAQKELERKFELAKERIAKMIARGALQGAETEMVDTVRGGIEEGGAFGAVDALRRTFGEDSMAGLPPVGDDERLTSRVEGRPARKDDIIRRLLTPRFISGLVQSAVDAAEEIDEEELAEAIVTGMVGTPPTGVDPAIERRRRARARLPLIRSELHRMTHPQTEEDRRMFAGMQSTFGIREEGRMILDEGVSSFSILQDALQEEMAEEERRMPPMGAIGVEMDWRQFMSGLDEYAEQVGKEYGIEMSGKRYLQWLMSKGKGVLPEDIKRGQFGEEGLYTAFEILRGGTIPPGSPVSEPLSEFIGTAADPRLPVTQEDINFIREEMVQLRQSIATGDLDLTQREGDIIVNAANELKAFEEMHSRMEPATTIATMRWS